MEIELSVQACFDPLQIESAAVRSSIEQISENTWQKWFYHWLQALHSHLPTAETYELNLRLTNDEEIQTLNHLYRNQDRPTDVLAFAALEADIPHPGNMPVYLGDVAISVETAVRQAQQQQHSEIVELAWLATHGLLHLLGWDHPDEASLQQMLNQQADLLQIVGLSPPHEWA
jgi:probable rRNA maturation factor